MKTSNNTLVFIHIHKTAGSTVRLALKSMFKNYFIIDSMDPNVSFDKFKSLPDDKRKELDTIFGHYVLELLPFINNPILFSYFRDPIDQFLSYYFYIKASKWNYYYELANELNLIDFAYKTKELGFDNMQTRHLSQHTNHLINRDLKLNSIELNEDYYSNAIEMLNKIDFVFLISQVDFSLVLFEDIFKLKKRPFYAKVNITKNRKPKMGLTLEEREILLDIQKWDVQLYEEVKKKNEILLAENSDILEKTNVFKIENEEYYNKNRLYFKYKTYEDKLRRKIKNL